MLLVREDVKILWSDEVLELEKQYYEKFGEYFIYFSYEHFHSTADKCAGQVYKETLEKAVKGDKPYRVTNEDEDDTTE